MNMTRKSSSLQLANLSHISECYLCRDVYKDPRILPCAHSFCLHCLEVHARGARVDDQVPCPICRRLFQVPADGLHHLQKNLYMSKLADYHTVANRAPKAGEGGIRCTICGSRGRKAASTCSVGSGGESDGTVASGSNTGVRWASKYCLDCRQEMCTKCAILHHKMKISRGHNIVELGSQMNAEKLRQGASFCPKHEDEMLKMYCFNCNKLVCLTCYAEVHNRHKCVDIKTASEIFNIQILHDAELLKDRKGECWNALEVVKVELKRMDEEAMRREDEIRKVAEDHKLRIEMDKMATLQKLEVTKKATTKDLENLRVEIERRIDAIDNFESFSAEITDKGSPTDIASVARQLHNQSIELQNMCKGPPIVILIPELKQRQLDKNNNVIGTIALSKKYVYQSLKRPDQDKSAQNKRQIRSRGLNNSWTSVVLGVILIPFAVLLLLFMLSR